MTIYSVVIPAHNAAGTIPTGLHALVSQTLPRHRYEIIVVDDGSTDGTGEIVQQFIQHVVLANTDQSVHSAGLVGQSPAVVQLIQQAHQGAAAARNAGAQVARGDIIIFLDADCVPAADWLERIVRPLTAVDVAGAGGRVSTHQQRLIPRFVQLEYDERYERVARHRYIDFISSATAGYWREVFHEIGGFDTTMLGAEDVDLSFRLAEAGHKLVFVSDAVVYHTHPDTVGAYARRKFKYAFWRAALYGRHPGKVAADSRTPQTQKLQIALAPVIGLSLVGVLVWRPLLLVAGVAAGAFLATAAAFMRRAWQTDPLIALLAPVLLFASAVAAAAGLAAGLLYRALIRHLPITGKS